MTSKLFRTVSVGRHVSLQNIIHNPGILAVLILLLLTVSKTVTTIQAGNPEYKEQLLSAFREYGGSMTDEKRSVLNEKQENWQNMTDRLSQAGNQFENGQISDQEYAQAIENYQMQLQDQQTYAAVVQQMNDGLNQEWVIYPRGFQALTGVNNTDTDKIGSMVITLILLFGLYGLFASDHEHENDFLYRISKNGLTKRLLSKGLWAFLFAAAICLMICLLQFLQIFLVFPMDFWNAPLQAILTSETSGTFPPQLESLSLLQYTALLYLIRFAGTLLTALEIMTVSAWSESRFKAACTCLVVLLVPWFLMLSGIEWASMLSFFNLLEGNSFLKNPWDWIKIPFWITVFSGLLLVAYRRKRLHYPAPSRNKVK